MNLDIIYSQKKEFMIKLRNTFTGTFLPSNKQIPSGAYQGPKFFSYKGKVLNDLRKQQESEQ